MRATDEKDVVVYYKPGCPFAAKLHLRLRLARIPHQMVRFRDDEAAAAAVRSRNDGNEISPTVLIGHTYLTNPGVHAVRAALSG
jgi:mycoredoxin